MSDAVLRTSTVSLPTSSENACGESSCFHCGLPVSTGAHYRVSIDGEEREVCCPGCQAVVQAIVHAGLADYYRYRTVLPGAPAEAPVELLKDLTLYDDARYQQNFVHRISDHAKEASLILEGITCSACVWLNEQRIARLPGVLGVDINYTTHRARVRWDESRIKFSEILRAVAAIGYSAHPFDPARQEEAQRKARNVALWRLFVAGFGMMQVMMYAVPSYLASNGDMSTDIAQLMRWASLILTLPVVVYSAAPFFSSAWRNIRQGQAGMDMPVALGVGGAFLASVWATVQGHGQVYFDSITMFVFFLLCGRYLEMAARARACDAVEKLVKLIPAHALLLADYPASNHEKQVAASTLKIGDYLLIPPGQAIPADGRVVRGASTVDESLFTGESQPKSKRLGSALTGGTLNLVSPLVMQVEKVGQETALAGIVRLMDRALAEKPRLAILADRVASWFVLGVLLIGALTFLAWYPVDPDNAFWITISVLVVTCPCALSLATPVALVAATGRLAANGLLVTRGNALETLAVASDYVFDKTGTLTLGRMVLQEVRPLGTLSSMQCLAIAGALEHGSEHPIAKALRADSSIISSRNASDLPAASSVSHVPGRGLEGTIDGTDYRLGSPQFVAELTGQPFPAMLLAQFKNSTVIALGNAGCWLALFVVNDQLRPDAQALVEFLRGLGKRVHLLTGDNTEAAGLAARKLGIENLRAAATPADKLCYLRDLQAGGAGVVMVGDGANDAPVLAQAQISIAIGRGTDVARASADMVLISDKLCDLRTGIETARMTLRVIRQNLAWALAYNLAALPLAMTGHVSPWMAGIGMSASSLIVVLNALRLRAKTRLPVTESRVAIKKHLALNSE